METASRLSLLQRHRAAREQLVSEAQEPSPSGRGGGGAGGAAASAPGSAAARHFCAARVERTVSAGRKRPLSALPRAGGACAGGSRSVVGVRPASASGVRERFAEVPERKTAGEPTTSPERDLPSQGPDLLAFGKFGPAPPLPPLPSGGLQDSAPQSGGQETDEDFTPEERQLEQESEEALNQLEALDAAVEALRLKLEVAKEDVESSSTELRQLRAAKQSWAQAAEESRKELADREHRLQELLAVLPAEEPEKELEARAVERLRVLQKQTDRLQEQVRSQQQLLSQRCEERQVLEVQVEGLAKERDEQKSLQQKVRSSWRAAEAQLKAKEEALAAWTQRRHDLEKAQLRMRAEAPRAAQAQAQARTQAASHCKERHAPDEAAAESARRRRQCLRLQHEVVELWEALRLCREAVSEQAE
ncbi:unnamed protein product [Effrenium voratum]|nr:unnamed protein product [Effrenium voratum]